MLVEKKNNKNVMKMFQKLFARKHPLMLERAIIADFRSLFS